MALKKKEHKTEKNKFNVLAKNNGAKKWTGNRRMSSLMSATFTPTESFFAD